MISYEQKLKGDLEWALHEAGMYFDETSQVHKTLKQLTQRLNELAIPYAVVGGMAMFAHGFRRFTEDVGLLVTRDGMRQIAEQLEGLGYVQPRGRNTKLRDTQTGVRIEFLITGGYPGDGRPKPVAFPDPSSVAVDIAGIKFLALPALVELKLASGISAAHRLKDLADAQELIRVLKLPRNFADQLNPYIRPKFDELWTAVEQHPEE